MRTHIVALVMVCELLLCLSAAPDMAEAWQPRPTLVDRTLAVSGGPFAIAHRGFGENRGEDPSRPIENTVLAVRRAFQAGVSVVEVDVQLTRDHRVVVFHDDVVPDESSAGFTCLNTLTLAELQGRLPYVPTLFEVLHEARRFARTSGPIRGVLIVELKAATPVCDPADRQESATVRAVTTIIRLAAMTRQVILTSLSPALIYLASLDAPEIDRTLTVSWLQFLTAPEAAAIGVDVKLIDKRLNLGLQWAEADTDLGLPPAARFPGPEFRLPGYRSVDELVTTAARVGARAIEGDLTLLTTGAPSAQGRLAGKDLVSALHEAGFEVFAFTVDTDDEWKRLEDLELDGIYTNAIGVGLDNQIPIP